MVLTLIVPLKSSSVEWLGDVLDEPDKLEPLDDDDPLFNVQEEIAEKTEH